MIKAALGDRLQAAGGFITMKSADGAGLDLYPAAALAGLDGYAAQRFIDYSSGVARSNNEVFRALGVQLLAEAEYYPFAVIDEIGGYDLIIPQFREALAELLSSELPCIGVIKTAEDAKRERQSLGLGSKPALFSERLFEALRNDTDTVIINTTGRDDEIAQRIVRQWVQEYAM